MYILLRFSDFFVPRPKMFFHTNIFGASEYLREKERERKRETKNKREREGKKERDKK